MASPWRHPAETSNDLYPNLCVTDNVVSGSILFHGSRLAVWGIVADLVRDGWYAVEDEYDPPCGRDVLSGFLFDLFQARGEFGRLLLVLAEAERRERERPEDLDPAWWEDPDLRRPVVDQLRHCLAALGDDNEIVTEAGTAGPRLQGEPVGWGATAAPSGEKALDASRQEPDAPPQSASVTTPDSAMVTEYQFHPLTEADAVDWDLWRVRVTQHPNGLWCVMSQIHVADAGGEWHEDGPYMSKADEWVERYCMPLDVALAVADRVQWTLQVSGKTAADVLAKEADR